MGEGEGKGKETVRGDCFVPFDSQRKGGRWGRWGRWGKGKAKRGGTANIRRVKEGWEKDWRG